MRTRTESNPKAATAVGFIIGMILVAVVLSFTKCGSNSGPASPVFETPPPPAGISPIGPSTGSTSGGGATAPPGTATPGSPPPPSTPAATCSGGDILRDQQGTIESIAVNGNVVTGTCLGNTELPGRFFCKVYLDERGGSPNTVADIGEQWSLVLPDAEAHRLVIDFEVDLNHDDVTDCQNDGTNATVEARIPPTPEGCELDLRCVEQRPAVADIENGFGLHKWLECNAPVSWTSNADESSEGERFFHGSWGARDESYQATAKATALADSRCMVPFEWTVPANPCASAILRAGEPRIVLEALVGRVSFAATSSSSFTVNWGDGGSDNFGPGDQTPSHEYPRREVDATYTITVSNECLRHQFQVRIPASRCEDRNPELSTGGGGPWSVVARNTIFSRASVSVPYSLGGAAFDGEVQIFWQNGSSTVKQRASVNKACGATASGAITWSNNSNSHNHFCNHGHVNPAVSYFLRFVENGQVLDSIELPRVGGRCLGN